MSRAREAEVDYGSVGCIDDQPSLLFCATTVDSASRVMKQGSRAWRATCLGSCARFHSPAQTCGWFCIVPHALLTIHVRRYREGFFATLPSRYCYGLTCDIFVILCQPPYVNMMITI